MSTPEPPPFMSAPKTATTAGCTLPMASTRRASAFLTSSRSARADDPTITRATARYRNRRSVMVRPTVVSDASKMRSNTHLRCVAQLLAHLRVREVDLRAGVKQPRRLHEHAQLAHPLD